MNLSRHVLCVILAVFASAGCAGAAEGKIEYPLVKRQVEKKEVDIPPSLPSVRFDPIEAGEAAKEGGFFVSESSAVNLAKIRVEHNRVRDMYVLEQKSNKKEAEILGGALDEANGRIVVLQTSLDKEREGTWFSRNAVTLGVVGGFVVGSTMTVAIVAAVAEVK